MSKISEGDRIKVAGCWYTVYQVTGNSVRVYETNNTFHITHIVKHIIKIPQMRSMKW